MALIHYGTVITDLLPALNADTIANLSFWTEETLYEYADEAARLIGALGVWVDRQPITVSSGEGSYALPVRTLTVIHVSLAGTSLRGINVQELDARDSDWRNSSGTVSHFAFDVSGFAILFLYKKPEAGGTAYVLRHTYFHAESSVSTARGAAVYNDFIKYRMLQKLRGHDGDGQMPDVAKHAAAMGDLYAEVFGRYWSEAA
jgi:hypothetical protein